MGYPDKTLVCVDCARTFTWTAGEQEYFAEKGFTELPKRCPDCRQEKKAQRDREGRGEPLMKKGGKK